MLSLEELLGVEVESVFGASKSLQKITEAPAAVTIVTAEEIERFGWRTLGEVLRSVRGFYVTNDRNYSYPGARGFQPPGDYSTRLLVMTDGLRLNDNIYDGALFDEDFTVDLDAVERIEIVRGPSSSLYGSSAFFGVVNLVMKPANQGGRGSITATSGSLGHLDTRAHVRHAFANGAGLSVRAGLADRDGEAGMYTPEYDTPDTNDGIAEGLDYMRRRNLLVRFEAGTLAVTGLFNTRTRGIPNAAYGSLFNRPGSNTDEHRAVGLSWQRPVGRGWTGVFRGGYDYYLYRGLYTYEGAEPGLEATYVDRAIGQMWYGEAQLSRSVDRHQFTGGVEHRSNPQQDQFSFIKDPYEPLWYDERASRVTAVYLQDQWRLSPKVLVNGGLRLDHYSNFDDPLKPRLAVILQPTPRTTVKGIYGGAFRAPSAYENYYQIPGLWEGRPDLRPEQISTVEGIVEHYAGRRLRLSANVFRNHVTDLITMVSRPADEDLVYYANVAGARAVGAEFEAEARWPGGLRGRLSYTYARAEVDDVAGSTPPNSPRHIVQGLLSMPIARGWFVSLDTQTLSSRMSLAGATVDPYVRPNVTATGPVGSRGRLTLTINNAADARFSDPVGEDFLQDTVRQYGRTARLQFAWSF